MTKLCIEYFENNYSFDAYLDDRSKKDNKFVNPLDNNEGGGSGENQDEEMNQQDQQSESEFSMSVGEPDEGEEGEGEVWERQVAEQYYKRTRDEIDSKYYVA